MSTYLYGGFDCMFLSCHVGLSEWIHTLWLPKCRLWVRVQLQPLKLQSLKRVRDMIRTYSRNTYDELINLAADMGDFGKNYD